MNKVLNSEEGLYTSEIWEPNARYACRGRLSSCLVVPGMHTNSPPLSSAAFHQVLLFPAPFYHPTLNTTFTTRVRRQVSHGRLSRFAGSSSSIIMHQSTSLCPPPTILQCHLAGNQMPDVDHLDSPTYAHASLSLSFSSYSPSSSPLSLCYPISDHLRRNSN